MQANTLWGRARIATKLRVIYWRFFLHLIHAESLTVPYKTTFPHCSTAGVMNWAHKPRSLRAFLSSHGIYEYTRQLEALAKQNTPFSLIKHPNLGGSIPGNGTIHPGDLRTTLIVLARRARCFAPCFPLCALDSLVDPLLARLT